MSNQSSTTDIDRVMHSLIAVNLSNTSLVHNASATMVTPFPDVGPPQDMTDKTIKNSFKKHTSSGYTVSRSRGTGSKREFSITYTNLTTEEKNLLAEFFDTTQGQSFTWNHPEPGSGAFEVYFADKKLHFQIVLSIFWSVTFKLVEK